MPPTGSYLLDTNIVIGLLAGDADIGEHVSAAGRVYVPSIVLGELYYGVQKSSRPAENAKRIDALAQSAAVLACDSGTATVYGELKARLRERGTPIPENDLWIAALAVQHDLTLITRDAHFDVLPVLRTVAWGR